MLHQIKQTFSNDFIRNTSWLGGAEFANRVFRLATTVVLARVFSPQDYGLIAIVLTANEFASVFTCRSGIGAKLVQATDAEVDTLCETAYWMSWIASVVIFSMQCLASLGVAWFYQDNRMILPICVLGLVHLTLPFFTVQVALIERTNRMNVIALCSATQAFGINLLTALFALLGWGAWSVVLALLLTTPAWILIAQSNCAWRPKSSFTLHHAQEIVNFAAPMIGSDLLVKVRDNLDYLLVGRFLGLEMLGIYYFAFNAGLGISLSVINSLTWSLWPHLCAARENLKDLRQRYQHGLKTIACVIIPMVLLQSSLAPSYVPIVFSSKWTIAIPILIVICLSAIPRPFFLAASQLLNAVGQPQTSLRWGLILTGIYAVALTIGVQFGIFAVAIAVLLSQSFVTPLFVFWAERHVFKAAKSF